MAEKKASVVTSEGNASRDLRLVPEGITFGFVEEAIKTSSANLGHKELCKGYKYFSEKYITDIRGRDFTLTFTPGICSLFIFHRKSKHFSVLGKQLF